MMPAPNFVLRAKNGYFEGVFRSGSEVFTKRQLLAHPTG
jgi:hypothetical protein